jgi:hypothetical protein
MKKNTANGSPFPEIFSKYGYSPLENQIVYPALLGWIFIQKDFKAQWADLVLIAQNHFNH